MSASEIPLWVRGYLKGACIGPCRFPTKFFELVKRPISADDCWEWLGAKDKRTHAPKYNNLQPRRLTYQQLLGSIPEGAILHPKCSRSGCINPDHMLVTDRAQALRGFNK